MDNKKIGVTDEKGSLLIEKMVSFGTHSIVCRLDGYGDAEKSWEFLQLHGEGPEEGVASDFEEGTDLLDELGELEDVVEEIEVLMELVK